VANLALQCQISHFVYDSARNDVLLARNSECAHWRHNRLGSCKGREIRDVRCCLLFVFVRSVVVCCGGGKAEISTFSFTYDTWEIIPYLILVLVKTKNLREVALDLESHSTPAHSSHLSLLSLLLCVAFSAPSRDPSNKEEPALDGTLDATVL
jgi:hypothetical protein